MRIALRRVLFGLLAVVALGVFAGPWSLYWLGLYAAGGTPARPAAIASLEQQQAAWRWARGEGVPSVPTLNPYTYFSAGTSGTPGLRVAWQVARTHLQDHRRFQGMLWWHLSGAALTIWLTRNWSTEQLLSKVAESQGNHAG